MLKTFYLKLVKQTRPSNLRESGYGLALLMTFLASSLLLAASFSMILVPSVVSYTNAISTDSMAKQIAEEALEAAKADILTQQLSGTTITTSYRYPSTGTITISVPTYPGSGSTTAKGSYYVTTVYARGFTFLLNANVTVGGNTTSVSRLVQLNATPSVLQNAFAIYSLRKAKSSYSGSAVKVRCTAYPTGMDIGFTSNGDFDIAGLRTCLGDSTLPLDVATGEKLAFGLRKLSSSYGGFAIKVRRSSDNTTQDIGFDGNGNLDTATLKSFVGTSSGYVTTWYDQSGSGKDATQATNSKQPRIVLAGALDMANNIPAIVFDGSDDYLGNTTLGGTLITGTDATVFVVAQQSGTATSGLYSRYVTLHKSNGSSLEDWQVAGGWQILAADVDARNIITEIVTKSAGGSVNRITSGVPFQATLYVNSANKLGMYLNGTLAEQSSTGGATLSPDQVYIGIAGVGNGTGGTALNGKISEFIVFNNSLSAANQQAIERSEGHYYNISGMQDGFVTTWYDQSGNGNHLTQTTAALQPLISQAAQRTGVYFDGAQYADITTLNATTDKLTLLSVAQINPDNAPSNGRVVSFLKTGDGNDWGSATSSALLLKIGNKLSNARNNDLSISTATTYGKDFQATVIFDGTNRTIRETQGGLVTNSTTTSGTGNVTLNTLRVGQSASGTASHEYWKGNIYELILFTTNPSTTAYQTLESEQQSYFYVN